MIDKGGTCAAVPAGTFADRVAEADAKLPLRKMRQETHPIDARADPSNVTSLLGRAKAMEEIEKETLWAWVKDRFQAKTGRNTMSLEKAARSLSCLEIQAAMRYTKSRETDDLIIPISCVYTNS